SPDVHEAAAEATRQVVSSRLEFAKAAESRSLLAAIASLMPADRLLSRDCDRFQLAREEQRELPLGRPRRIKVSLARSFRLPQAEWTVAVSCGDHFLAAGWLEKGLVCCRANWDGMVQLPGPGPLRLPSECSTYPLLMAAEARSLSAVYVHLAGHGRRI